MRIAGQRDRQWNLKSLICAENSENKGLKLKKQKFLSNKQLLPSMKRKIVPNIVPIVGNLW